MAEITNTQDVIDSRDIIARIDELETDQEMLKDEITETEEHRGLAEKDEVSETELDSLQKDIETAREALIDFNEENEEELNSLRAVAEECEGYSDWAYGEALISEMYFTEYCMDMLKDIGDLPQDIPSYIAIDEEQTAENLKADYMTVDFDGTDYYMRSC